MKKNQTLSVLEIAPQLPHCPNFGLKKQFPVQVLRRHEMTCASELKPHIHNNEDPWEKIHHFQYWNSVGSNHMAKIPIGYLSREFQYLKWWIFSHGSSLLCIWGLSSEAQVISCLLSTRTGNCFFGPKSGQCGSCGAISNTESVWLLIFFHRSSSFHRWGLSSQA